MRSVHARSELCHFLSFPGGNELGVLELREVLSRDTWQGTKYQVVALEAYFSFPGGNESGVLKLREVLRRNTKNELHRRMRSFAQEHDFLSFPGGNENGVLELREVLSRDTNKKCGAEANRMDAACCDLATAAQSMRLGSALVAELSKVRSTECGV
jgi:hypothetical protein